MARDSSEVGQSFMMRSFFRLAAILSLAAWLALSADATPLANARGPADEASSLCRADSADPLPSWQDGATKKAIVDFVLSTTSKESPQFVPVEQRLATFDQDGTLWVEQPMYTQVMFVIHRLVELAPGHPEWKTTEPFKSALMIGMSAPADFPMKNLDQITLATDAGMSVAAYQAIVKDWLAKAEHPRFHRPYTQLAYQPMLEVIRYLRGHGFKTYIVTGSGQEFVRTYAEQVYGIPPEWVIGSALQTHYAYDAQGKGILMRAPKLLLDDNFSGKPEDIYLMTGRRPYAAFGNSTGDRQMLEWTQAGQGTRLMMLVHHDDGEREYDYGAHSKVGTFSDALMNEAKERGWIVISMKNDWKRIFAFDR
jgi:phosphoglycolate phosphatase-like HAD superfamily hydrolase